MNEQTGLQERLEHALAGRLLEEVLPAPRALVGLEAAAEASMDVVRARRAAEKLRAGGKLLPAEVEALEVGLRLARPAHRVEYGRLPPASAPGMEGVARVAIEAQLPGIAQVGWGWDRPLGTAFQVAPYVLMTAAHVAERLLQGHGDLANAGAVACFDADERRQEQVIPLEGMPHVHPGEDVALLTLVSAGPLEWGLRLAREPGLRRGDQVLAVGYPLYSPDTPACVEVLFEQIYSVKRASPGSLLEAEGERLYHDCTTLPGSSGSPLFDWRTGLVVGIHATGRFAYRNVAVSTRVVYMASWLQALIAGWE